jgi:hypothetical protein
VIVIQQLYENMWKSQTGSGKFEEESRGKSAEVALYK